jgi:hypothetical protein
MPEKLVKAVKGKQPKDSRIASFNLSKDNIGVSDNLNTGNGPQIPNQPTSLNMPKGAAKNSTQTK